MPDPQQVCLTPRLAGVGGMVSFQHKLAAGLAQRGIAVTYDLNDHPYQAVLIIGGTRRLAELLRARWKGVRLVQRLDGMNWLHRLPHTGGRPPTGLRHFLRAEYGNWLLTTIRSRLADRIVYQSRFSQTWWEQKRGPTPVPSAVIYNGVDLQTYTPTGTSDLPENCFRLLMVEGSLMGGYESGLDTGARLVENLNTDHQSVLNKPVELMVAGRVPDALLQQWADRSPPLKFAGLVPPQDIPHLDRSAHLLYSADINAACPNSVIEALACGLPVVAYDTGALPELVSLDAGRIARYGGDPWRMQPPDIGALAQAALEVLTQRDSYRLGARQRAETCFGLDTMVEKYLGVLLN